MAIEIIFFTERLLVRRTISEDITFLYELWTNPEVMRFVGFPQGLKITQNQVMEQIATHKPGPFDQVLIVERTSDNTVIGQCKLGYPDADMISETDIKFFPEAWAKGYGKELKAALVDYLFDHTNAQIVQATPNILNKASQKMQESVGAKPVSKTVFNFPESMKSYTCSVHSIIYHVTRESRRNTPKAYKPPEASK